MTGAGPHVPDEHRPGAAAPDQGAPGGAALPEREAQPSGLLAADGSERPAAYLRSLLLLLLPAALFNSYDGELRAVLLTQLKQSFHVGTAALGVANIPIGAGQFIAFFAVLQADRIGRRPILLWSIAGYTVFTTLTAVSWNLWSFASFQALAQVFIGAEFGVAVTLLAEEVPKEHRGRYLSWLLLVSPLGAVLAGLLVAVGFLHNPIGWRAFFLIAALPLAVVAVARRNLQESRAFVSSPRGSRAGGATVPLGSTRSAASVLGGMVAVWRSSWRLRIAAVGGIAFFQGLVSAGAVGWWTYYAEHERHLGTGTAGSFFAAAALCSVGGYLLCGTLMDRVGRRPTAALYTVLAVGCAVGTFQVANRWVMLPLLLGTAFFGIGVAPVLSAFAAELFPTDIRAQASAWIRNALGNAGSVTGPALIGILGASTGPLGSIGLAATVMALVYLVVLPIVWRLPETRDIALQSTE